MVCKHCGRCCYGESVRTNVGEVERIAEHINKPINEVMEYCIYEGSNGNLYIDWDLGRDKNPCIFLRGRDCSIHAVKPEICVQFPTGPRDVVPDFCRYFEE